jgi:hypothetical protein
MHDGRKGSGASAEHPVVSATSNNHTPILLTREAVATRWSVSTRTVDRRRLDGSLPWVDLNGGRCRKPIVRFLLKDIEDYEQKARLECRLPDSARFACAGAP